VGDEGGDSGAERASGWGVVLALHSRGGTERVRGRLGRCRIRGGGRLLPAARWTGRPEPGTRGSLHLSAAWRGYPRAALPRG